MSPYYQKLRKAAGDALLLIPGVAAIVHDEERRLLLVEKHNGSWSLPAGAIEPGESPAESVARELYEETGLTCEHARLLACLGGRDFRLTYPNGHQVEHTVALYHCLTSRVPSPRDRHEIKSLRFFAHEEFPGLPLPYDPDMLYLADDR